MGVIVMKKYIFGIITGSIITFVITISAVYLYSAKDVEFIPEDSNWNVHNVGDAINNLYSSFSLNPELLWLNPNPNSAFGAQTINVDNGNYRYLIVTVNQFVSPSSPYHVTNTFIDKNTDDWYIGFEKDRVVRISISAGDYSIESNITKI